MAYKYSDEFQGFPCRYDWYQRFSNAVNTGNQECTIIVYDVVDGALKEIAYLTNLYCTDELSVTHGDETYTIPVYTIGSVTVSDAIDPLMVESKIPSFDFSLTFEHITRFYTLAELDAITKNFEDKLIKIYRGFFSYEGELRNELGTQNLSYDEFEHDLECLGLFVIQESEYDYSAYTIACSGESLIFSALRDSKFYSSDAYWNQRYPYPYDDTHYLIGYPANKILDGSLFSYLTYKGLPLYGKEANVEGLSTKHICDTLWVQKPKTSNDPVETWDEHLFEYNYAPYEGEYQFTQTGQPIDFKTTGVWWQNGDEVSDDEWSVFYYIDADNSGTFNAGDHMVEPIYGGETEIFTSDSTIYFADKSEYTWDGTPKSFTVRWKSLLGTEPGAVRSFSLYKHGEETPIESKTGSRYILDSDGMYYTEATFEMEEIGVYDLKCWYGTYQFDATITAAISPVTNLGDIPAFGGFGDSADNAYLRYYMVTVHGKPTIDEVTTFEDLESTGLDYKSQAYKILGWYSTALIPDGYTQLEYIESTGTQYIDTGVHPTSNTRVVTAMDFSRNTLTTCGVFGGRSSSVEGSYTFWIVNGKLRSDYGSTNQNTDVDAAGYIEIDKNKNVTTMNGVEVTAPTNDFSSTNTLTIFAVNGKVDGSAEVDTRMVGASLFKFEIYENDVLIQNLYPCKRDFDGEIGLYDVVNDKFYANSGTNEFLAGSESPTVPGSEPVPPPDIPIEPGEPAFDFDWSFRSNELELQGIDEEYYVFGLNEVTDLTSLCNTYTEETVSDALISYCLMNNLHMVPSRRITDSNEINDGSWILVNGIQPTTHPFYDDAVTEEITNGKYFSNVVDEPYKINVAMVLSDGFSKSQLDLDGVTHTKETLVNVGRLSGSESDSYSLPVKDKFTDMTTDVDGKGGAYPSDTVNGYNYDTVLPLSDGVWYDAKNITIMSGDTEVGKLFGTDQPATALMSGKNYAIRGNNLIAYSVLWNKQLALTNLVAQPYSFKVPKYSPTEYYVDVNGNTTSEDDELVTVDTSHAYYGYNGLSKRMVDRASGDWLHPLYEIQWNMVDDPSLRVGTLVYVPIHNQYVETYITEQSRGFDGSGTLSCKGWVIRETDEPVLLAEPVNCKGTHWAGDPLDETKGDFVTFTWEENIGWGGLYGQLVRGVITYESNDGSKKITLVDQFFTSGEPMSVTFNWFTLEQNIGQSMDTMAENGSFYIELTYYSYEVRGKTKFEYENIVPSHQPFSYLYAGYTVASNEVAPIAFNHYLIG